MESPNLAELKKAVHSARVSLAYQKETERSERGGPRAEQIALAQAKLDAAVTAYKAAQPEPVSLRLRSPYFIGPRLKRGRRGNGPTIRCFRCGADKPREEYYDKGTICPDCIIKRSAEWSEKNPDKSKASKEKWAEENREANNAKERQRRTENPELVRAEDKEKRKKNRLINNKSQREYLRRRKKKDPQFRALVVCKQRLWNLLKSAGVRKNTRTEKFMGINKAGFIAHIESLFLPGMSWENYGKGATKWNIEHIKPCSLFDHSDEAQAKACWNYLNLRPWWEPENLSKSDILPCGRRGRDLRGKK